MKVTKTVPAGRASYGPVPGEVMISFTETPRYVEVWVSWMEHAGRRRPSCQITEGISMVTEGDNVLYFRVNVSTPREVLTRTFKAAFGDDALVSRTIEACYGKQAVLLTCDPDAFWRRGGVSDTLDSFVIPWMGGSPAPDVAERNAGFDRCVRIYRSTGAPQRTIDARVAVVEASRAAFMRRFGR